MQGYAWCYGIFIRKVILGPALVNRLCTTLSLCTISHGAWLNWDHPILHMTIYFNPADNTFSTIRRNNSIEIYKDKEPDKKSRQTHKFSLSETKFDVRLETKFTGNRRNRPYIDIQITYNSIPIYRLSACLNDALESKGPASYSSYYKKFTFKDATLDDWERACDIITDVYAQKDIWFLNEVPDAIDRFNSLLYNIEIQSRYKLIACKVFMELIEDCKLNRYQGISQILLQNCQVIQQLAIEAINQNTDLDTGVTVMELLYKLLKEADLLKDFYRHLDHRYE